MGSVASVERVKNLLDFELKEDAMLLKISPELLPKFRCFCSSPELIMMFVYMKWVLSHLFKACQLFQKLPNSRHVKPPLDLQSFDRMSGF
jgi:hypothetical protein